MTYLRWGFNIVIATLAFEYSYAQPATLFSDHTPLHLELTADFSSMLKVRDENTAVFTPGSLTMLGENGASFSIDIKPRGQSRLNRSTCYFPLLFLRFKSEELGGTLFKGQDILPVTTHCKPQKRYLQYMHKEFLAYRSYNLLTENSLNVRLVHIKYVDSQKKLKTQERAAIFVEHFDAVAQRLDAQIKPPEDVAFGDISKEELALMEVYQYMIGNTDWSAPFGHNVLLLQRDRKIIPVAFDFDSAGAVNAPYATTSEKLKIRSVTQRLFRGYCKPGTMTTDAVNQVIAKQEEILDINEQHKFLEASTKKKLQKFYLGFFKVARDPKLLNKRILKACRTPG